MTTSPRSHASFWNDERRHDNRSTRAFRVHLLTTSTRPTARHLVEPLSLIKKLFNFRSSASVAYWYVVLTLLMTWPLGRGLGRDVPADLGDPLLNCWILGWDADHLLKFLSGRLNAFTGFWNANIFFPEPLTLAYSEHLIAQAFQILPFYALTRNLLLGYNLLFLSTFVLSALGMYLLVRDLTGRSLTAFVAGLFYGFAPYRLAELPHLQVLSSQWMPFALLGLHRYITGRRRAPLAWATVALVVQSLSCGYYMLFFAPLFAAYALFEIARCNRWRDPSLWRDLLIAGSAVVLILWPFVSPYLELRRLGFPRRPIEEVSKYSADVYGYFTANHSSRLYGHRLRAWPRPEGEVFPGLVPIALAIVAMWTGGVDLLRRTQASGSTRWRTTSAAIAILVLAHGVLIAAVLLTGGFGLWLGPLSIGVKNVWRLIRDLVIGVVILWMLSPRARGLLREASRSTLAFFAFGIVVAFWLSLGPAPTSRGIRLVGSAAYYYFYTFVPGFDGIRVPARLAMLVALCLSVVAAYGAAGLERGGRRGRVILAALAAVFLLEATGAPIALNGTFSYANLEPTPGRVYPASRAPAVYKSLNALPADAALVEFPFGVDGYEVRYMYYSTLHWKPLLNGYSGGFPLSYSRNKAALSRVIEKPDVAWAALAASGATHVIVHESAYLRRRRRIVGRWLRDHDAREIAVFGRDHVFELSRPGVALSGQ